MTFGRMFDSRQGPFGRLQRDINELFDTVVAKRIGLGFGLLTGAFPPVNIYEDRDALVVECELPGVDQASLDIAITADTLTLKGERPALRTGGDSTLHIQERGYGSFSRAITLPAAVDNDKAEAKFENGVLRIRIAKAPEAQPRQVKVNVAGTGQGGPADSSAL